MKLKHILLAKSLGAYINTLSLTHPEKALELAYRYFSNPRVGKLVPHNLPKILQNVNRERFEHSEYDFNTYKWKGNENVILLVHGWESNAARWEKMLPYLQQSGSTIVAIDGPAHGLTTGLEFNVPVYAEMIQIAVEKFKPQIMIGHSIGGAACLYYQHKFQNQGLEKMVILGAPSELKTLTANYFKLIGLNAKTIALMEHYFLTRFNFRPEEFSGSRFSESITIDGIIAHDIDDTVVAFAEGEKIAQSWKSARFIQTKGLGHSLHGAELYSEISDFLFGAD